MEHFDLRFPSRLILIDTMRLNGIFPSNFRVMMFADTAAEQERFSNVFQQASTVVASGNVTAEQRQQADRWISGVWTASPSTLLPVVKKLCENAQVADFVKVHALQALLTFFLRRHEEQVVFSQLNDILIWILNFLGVRNAESISSVVSRQVAHTSALLLKMSLLLVKHPDDTPRPPSVQRLEEVLKIMETSVALCANYDQTNMFADLIKRLVIELSEPHGGISVEKHEKCHRLFHKMGFLRSVLALTLQKVNAHSVSLSTHSPHRGSRALRESTISSLLGSLALLDVTLRWNFVFRPDFSPSDTTMIKTCAPKSWGNILFNSEYNIVDVLARIYVASVIPEEARRSCEEIFLSLACLEGPIFNSGIVSESVFVGHLAETLKGFSRTVANMVVTPSARTSDETHC